MLSVNFNLLLTLHTKSNILWSGRVRVLGRKHLPTHRKVIGRNAWEHFRCNRMQCRCWYLFLVFIVCFVRRHLFSVIAFTAFTAIPRVDVIFLREKRRKNKNHFHGFWDDTKECDWVDRDTLDTMQYVYSAVLISKCPVNHFHSQWIKWVYTNRYVFASTYMFVYGRKMRTSLHSKTNIYLNCYHRPER